MAAAKLVEELILKIFCLHEYYFLSFW